MVPNEEPTPRVPESGEDRTAAGVPEPQPAAKPESDEIVIDIKQYSTLLEILNDPKAMLKIICMLAVLVLTVFIGLAFTVIAIKRVYPYNEIRTNTFGATTMANEETELTYWLFNPAEPWACSGIEVQEGDVLTIRSSGQINTSIHHLVHAATYNVPPRYSWTDTDGGDRSPQTRTDYRFYPKSNPDALIMQVKEPDERSGRYLRPNLYDYSGDTDFSRYYYIGKERTDLRIRQSGTLHFAVNDIILTQPCIDEMICENEKRIYGPDSISRQNYWRGLYDTLKLKRKELRTKLWVKLSVEKDSKSEDWELICKRIVDSSSEETLRIRVIEYFQEAVDSCRLLSRQWKERGDSADSVQYKYNRIRGTITKCLDYARTREYYKLDQWQEKNKDNFYFGGHPIPIPCDNIEEYPDLLEKKFQTLDELNSNCYPFYNEMTYYRAEKYTNAWYDDNVGSVLIVVERKKK